MSLTDIIENMRKKGITKEELENAKKQTVVEMTLNRDSTVSLMSSNARNVIYNMPFEPFCNRIDRINKVTVADVNSLIERDLRLESMSMGLIGPAK